ncbi:MAG TPA: hypothetical protein VGB99_16690 [Acidobacteriota bacterium]|jgi:hypothetical protein
MMAWAAALCIIVGSFCVALAGPRGGPDTAPKVHQPLRAIGILLWIATWPLFIWHLTHMTPS